MTSHVNLHAQHALHHVLGWQYLVDARLIEYASSDPSEKRAPQMLRATRLGCGMPGREMKHEEFHMKKMLLVYIACVGAGCALRVRMLAGW